MRWKTCTHSLGLMVGLKDHFMGCTPYESTHATLLSHRSIAAGWHGDEGAMLRVSPCSLEPTGFH